MGSPVPTERCIVATLILAGCGSSGVGVADFVELAANGGECSTVAAATIDSTGTFNPADAESTGTFDTQLAQLVANATGGGAQKPGYIAGVVIASISNQMRRI